MKLEITWAGLICLFLPPMRLKNQLLRYLGWEISHTCRIGFSWISTKKLKMLNGSNIGHGNFLQPKSIFLSKGSGIGHLNKVTGPVRVILYDYAAIGNQNIITRGQEGVSWGGAMLKLGCWSKLTVGHVVDCTRSVIVGDFTTFAGRGTQIWTHGYIHAPEGRDRFRIDGSVRIGNNVYVGSSCVINAGVTVGKGITIGSASCVARSLYLPGLYVSQALRYVELDYNVAYEKYPELRIDGLVERVVHKRSAR